MVKTDFGSRLYILDEETGTYHPVSADPGEVFVEETRNELDSEAQSA